MSWVSCPSNENPEILFFLNFEKKTFFNFLKKNSQDFHYLEKKPLTWGCVYTLWEALIPRI
jgi:hypothetical protein